MQKDELVLSDVHLQVKNDKSLDYCVSRFYFTDEITAERKKKCVASFEESVSSTSDDGKSLPVQVREHEEFHSTEIHSDAKERRKTSEQGIESEELNSNESKHEKSDIEWTFTKTKEEGDQAPGADDCRRSDKSEKGIDSIDRDRTTEVLVKADCDVDGDVIVKRRKRKHNNYSVITIAHKLETNLENVGLQIWLASLYMADFIVGNKFSFTGRNVLDLGAGVGLTSIVSALYAHHVICTDIGQGILDLAQHNLDINNTRDCVNFSVKELDWFDSKFIPDDENEDCYKEILSDKDLMTSNIVISADVIYDDDITDALFRTVYGLMINTNIDTWYISLEKRYLFTIGDLDVVCPAYKHFRKCLNQLEEMTDDVLFTVCLVEDVQQCFQYGRTEQLELWKVTSKRKEADEGC